MPAPSPRAPRRAALAGAALAVLLLTGCGPNIPAPATDAPSEPVDGSGSGTASASPAEDVRWSDYDDGLQDRIDDASVDADCEALREEKAEAIRLDGQTERDTGHDNAALRAYIDESLERADCG